TGECLDVTPLPRELDLTIEVCADQREPFEVTVDELLRLRIGNAELLREREGPDSVDDREVHRLGAVAHRTSHLLRLHPEDERRRLAVDVRPRPRRFDEGHILRVVRQDAELDLRIVGGDEYVPVRRDETTPDLRTD